MSYRPEGFHKQSNGFSHQTPACQMEAIGLLCYRPIAFTPPVMAPPTLAPQQYILDSLAHLWRVEGGGKEQTHSLQVSVLARCQYYVINVINHCRSHDICK